MRFRAVTSIESCIHEGSDHHGPQRRHSTDGYVDIYLKVGEGDLLTAAVVDFRSRAHRDEVMARVMCDERVEQMVGKQPLAGMNRMSYGGF
ncbi:MAG: hypothetical protein WKF42_02970, partial [Solirubrobacteraceae bacterium]